MSGSSWYLDYGDPCYRDCSLGVFARVTVTRHRNSPISEQIEVERIVAVFEVRGLAAITALGDVVRDTGEDDAGGGGPSDGATRSEAAMQVWGLLHVST